MRESDRFGNLENVPLREAWPHEAQDFTPWLAGNLEQVSRVIGIPLELVHSEVEVEEFSADILARDSTDGSLVLIENQLERSDHGHLGQILTYLAGLDSRTVVWIARDFSPAHLSAIRWMNYHTADPFSFLAVQVRVVRIGDSAMAPVFEIRERPSEWDRRIREVANETLSETARFRRDFWIFYSKRHPNDLDLRPGFRDSNAYDRVEELDVSISLYLAPSNNQVGMYVVGQDGESIETVQQRLQPYENRVRDELGIQLMGNPISRHFALLVMENIVPKDRDSWPRIADWFHKNLTAYRRALSEPQAETSALPIRPRTDG